MFCLAVRRRKRPTIERLGRILGEDLEETEEEAEAAKLVIASRNDDSDDAITGIGAIVR